MTAMKYLMAAAAAVALLVGVISVTPDRAEARGFEIDLTTICHEGETKDVLPLVAWYLVHVKETATYGPCPLPAAPVPFAPIVLLDSGCENADGTFTYSGRNTGSAQLRSLGVVEFGTPAPELTNVFDPAIRGGGHFELVSKHGKIYVTVGPSIQDSQAAEGLCYDPAEELVEESDSAGILVPILAKLPYAPVSTPWWMQTPMPYE